MISKGHVGQRRAQGRRTVVTAYNSPQWSSAKHCTLLPFATDWNHGDAKTTVRVSSQSPNQIWQLATCMNEAALLQLQQQFCWQHQAQGSTSEFCADIN